MTSPTTQQDFDDTALCIWREARGEGLVGMTAVGCVIRNRVERHRKSYTDVVMQKWAFSSMTAPGDPQLNLHPGGYDKAWPIAKQVTAAVMQGLADTTAGSTLYHDDSIGFPKSWNRSKCRFTVKIGRLTFYREV